MPKRRFIRLALFALLVGLGGDGMVHAQEPAYGHVWCHDPSTMIKTGSRYYYYMTGRGIPLAYTTDLRNWTYGGSVFPGDPPAWVSLAVPDYDPGNWAWAPDVAYFNGKYHVYYSVSQWGTIDSVIGLVTSPSLITPTWTDQGKVVQSDAAPGGGGTDTTDYNCIDPSILVDTDSKVWMTFGSYSSGIVITEIDPATGLRKNPVIFDATLLANNSGYRGWGSSIEGAFTYKHGSYYYLFVNYGECCSGVDSTYNIRVGRSSSVTGPYVDKGGIDMRDGGGTMLLESSGRYIGPGHAGILNDGGTEWFTYHYYDGNDLGASKHGLSQLGWDENDWPVLPNDWSGLYTFNADAHEQMGLYDGTLQSGAAIVSDPVLGDALELDGSGYVALPDPVANCKTVTAWVKWNGGGDWQRIFDFGTDTSQYMFLSPRASSGKMRFGIRNGGGEQTVEAPFALPTNTWCHVAVTLDGDDGIIYLSGQPVATNAITIRPWELLARNNLIGDSQFSSDAGFDGRIASFRVFARALSADEVRTMAGTIPSLAHRYSFASDVGDSIGMANGTLKGSASIANGALNLPGTSGSYGELPGGLVSGCRAVTIEYWTDLGANGDWARVFDFGNIDGPNGANYLFFTSHSGFGDYRLDLNGTVLAKSGGNLNNQAEHVVCVLDPANSYGAVYLNGALAMQQTITLPALDTVGNAWSFLGRSLFSADPYLNGAIKEFRIYDGRLAPDQIALNNEVGPDVVYQPTSFAWSKTVDTLSFEWPTYPGGYAVEYKTSLTDGSAWMPLATPPPANGTNALTVSMDSISSSNAFFQLRQ